MNNKIINGLNIICLLMASVGAFFSIYLLRIPEKVQNQPPAVTTPAPPKEPQYIRVGILGESRSDGSGSKPYNEEVVVKLFQVLKEQKVQAVFVTGNFVFGWTKSQTAQTDDSNTNVYSDTAFRNQLLSFAQLFQRFFGDTVKLYPMMGSHEAIGPDVAKVFRDVFNLQENTLLGNDFVAYSVSLGNAFFAVFPTDYYDLQQKVTIEHSTTPKSLEWLKSVLIEAAPKHRFLFVLGHEPAFTTPTLLNKPYGLDENPRQRDAFWQILKDNGVLAYFASREHLYDRTIRYGVWQVISGGGGTPLYEGEVSANAFFHCLVLTLPQNKEGVPSVKVLDAEGNIRDEFELKLQEGQQPLFQLRIS